MVLGRRQVLRVVLVGGGATALGVPLDALAMPGGLRPLPPGQLLESLLFDFIWPVIENAAIDYLKGLVSQEVQKIGRSFGIRTETTSPNAGGTSALVNMRVRKGGQGLLVHGHMMDGSKVAFSHDGTAPSHAHPAMQQHIATIVGRAHGYLKGKGQ
jgi:hypothetical protein